MFKVLSGSAVYVI